MSERADPDGRPARRRFAVGVRWRDPQVWRLGSGLVLFAFALTHFLNHALGLVSVEAMDAVQAVRRGFWRSAPGTILLYGSLAVHVVLALGKLAGRRTWRMAPWEAAQIALGLSIPILAAAHVAGTRFVAAAAGFDDTYTAELRLLWPGLALSQSHPSRRGLASRHDRPAPLASDDASVRALEPRAARGRRAGADARDHRLDRSGPPAVSQALRRAAHDRVAVRRGRRPDRTGRAFRLDGLPGGRAGVPRLADDGLAPQGTDDHLFGRAHPACPAGRHASRDQPLGWRASCGGVRRTRPLHDVSGEGAGRAGTPSASQSRRRRRRSRGSMRRPA